MQEKLKIGISGGTFDPIHIGHLVIAEQAREKMGLDRVLFIPSGNPPHKRDIEVTAAEDRYNMVQKAIEGNPYFEASRMEIDRGGYTYTVDTLRELRRIYGENALLYFIIGADILWDLPGWKEQRQVFSLCEFIAVLRPGYDRQAFSGQVELLQHEYGAVIHWIGAPLIDVSSTMLREKVSLGQSIRYLVPEAVENEINTKGLYRVMAEDGKV